MTVKDIEDIEIIPESDIEEIDDNDNLNGSDEDITKEDALDLMKSFKIGREPSILSKVTAFGFGHYRSYKHKTVVTFLQPFYQEKKIALETDFGSNYIVLITKNEEILKMHSPLIDKRGNHNYYVIKGQQITCHPANIEDAFLYPESYRDESVIPDLFNKADKYHLAEEISKARNRNKANMIMSILLAIGLGFGLASFYYSATGNLGDNGDDWDISGDYVEDKDINNNDDTNGNGDDTVIIDFFTIPELNIKWRYDI